MEKICQFVISLRIIRAKRRAVRSFLLTALDGHFSPNSNVSLVADLNVTIQMRVTIIDAVGRMNKNPVNPVGKVSLKVANFRW